MIEVVQFEPRHVDMLRIQAKQAGETLFDPVIYVKVGESFTGMLDGEVLFCAGRAYGRGVWAMLSVNAKHHMVAITRHMKNLLSMSEPWLELEALIACDFPEARRWANMLGFWFKEYDPTYGADVYVRPPCSRQ